MPPAKTLAERFGVTTPRERSRLVAAIRDAYPDMKCLYLQRKKRARKTCGKCPPCYAERLMGEEL